MLLPSIEGLSIDLPEIQELDARAIIEAKLEAAKARHDGRFIVEDTSLHFDSLNGLPGPLIKWFLKTIGNDGLYRLAQTFGTPARATTCLGYMDEHGQTHFFEGSIPGAIVAPRGNDGFGWDPIFEVSGTSKTFAEMTKSEKQSCSMRKAAVEQLKQHLTLQQ